MNRFWSIVQGILQLIGMFGGSPTPTPPTPPGPKPPTPPEDPGQVPQFVQDLLDAHNRFRIANNQHMLKLDMRLTAAAQKFAEVMAKMQKMSHEADGTSFVQRCKAEGYPYPTGENIAMGYPTVDAVCDGWENSRGHRANMLSSQSTTVGFGRWKDARGYYYWCADFGGGVGAPSLPSVAGFAPGGLVCPGCEA